MNLPLSLQATKVVISPEVGLFVSIRYLLSSYCIYTPFLNLLQEKSSISLFLTSRKINPRLRKMLIDIEFLLKEAAK